MEYLFIKSMFIYFGTLCSCGRWKGFCLVCYIVGIFFSLFHLSPFAAMRRSSPSEIENFYNF